MAKKAHTIPLPPFLGEVIDPVDFEG